MVDVEVDGVRGLLARRWRTVWFALLVAGSLFFLATTFFATHLETSPLTRFLYRFSLQHENNVAAWWSGILLILASLHAADGYFLHRRSQPSVAFGWAVLALVLFLLSADEIGSIHERAGLMLPFGVWLSLLPFALVLSGAFGYGLWSLWKDPDQRRPVVWNVVAFALFASVALQEFLEHNTQWWGPFAAFRVSLEEGTELLGALILVRTGMGNSRGLFGVGAASGEPALQVLSAWRRPLFLAGLVAVIPLVLVTAALPDQVRGHPSDWLAAAGFLFASLVAVRDFLRSGRNPGWAAWLASGCCLLASVSSVDIHPVDPGRRVPVLFALTLLLAVSWLLDPRRRKGFAWKPCATLAVASAFCFVETSLFAVYLVSAGLAVAAYTINAELDAVADGR